MNLDSGMELKSGQASNPYQNYYPKRHLKIEESPPKKQKGELSTNFNFRRVNQLPARTRDFSSKHKVYSCGFCHLTIFFVILGLLEQILSLPERLPRLPYLGSSVSMQSVDSGNSTTTKIEGMKVVGTDELWQYGLWSFQTGGTKLERFLPKNQHTVFPHIVSSLE